MQILAESGFGSATTLTTISGWCFCWLVLRKVSCPRVLTIKPVRRTHESVECDTFRGCELAPNSRSLIFARKFSHSQDYLRQSASHSIQTMEDRWLIGEHAMKMSVRANKKLIKIKNCVNILINYIGRTRQCKILRINGMQIVASLVYEFCVLVWVIFDIFCSLSKELWEPLPDRSSILIPVSRPCIAWHLLITTKVTN